MQSEARQNETEIKSVTQLLSKDDEISQAILFGSMIQGTLKPGSDIDIAIKTVAPLDTQKKINLVESLANLLGRPVDLIDLRTVGEPLLGQILQYGKQIKGNDSYLASLALKHLYANEDFMPYVKRALKERRERWIK